MTDQQKTTVGTVFFLCAGRKVIQGRTAANGAVYALMIKTAFLPSKAGMASLLGKKGL